MLSFGTKACPNYETTEYVDIEQRVVQSIHILGSIFFRLVGLSEHARRSLKVNAA